MKRAKSAVLIVISWNQLYNNVVWVTLRRLNAAYTYGDRYSRGSAAVRQAVRTAELTCDKVPLSIHEVAV